MCPISSHRYDRIQIIFKESVANWKCLRPFIFHRDTNSMRFDILSIMVFLSRGKNYGRTMWKGRMINLSMVELDEYTGNDRLGSPFPIQPSPRIELIIRNFLLDFFQFKNAESWTLFVNTYRHDYLSSLLKCWAVECRTVTLF